MPVVIAGVGLEYVLLFCVLLILAQHHKQWLDPIFAWIFKDRHAWWAKVLLYPVHVVGGIWHAAVHFITSVISNAAAGGAGAAGRFFHGLEYLTDLSTLSAQRFATETLLGFRYLRNQAIPKLIEVSVAPVRRDATLAKALAQASADTITAGSVELANGLRSLPWGAPLGWPARVAALMNAFEHIWDQVFKHVIPRLDLIQYTTLPRVAGDVQDIWDDLYRTGRNSLPRIRTRLGNLEDDVAGIFNNPLAWLEALLVSGAGILMLTRVLAKVAPNLFCDNVTRATRELCGFDPSILDDLLGLLLLAAGPFSIVEAARFLQGVTDEVADGVRYFVTP